MAITTFEKGIEKGIEKGHDMGRRAVLRDLMEARFGPLPEDVTTRLDGIPAGRIPEMTRALAHGATLDELVAILDGGGTGENGNTPRNGH